MSITAKLLDRVAAERGYECTVCGQSYEEERLNCHACGVDAVMPRGN